MRFIILLLIVVPACEIGVLLLSGKTIGVWATIGVIVLTGLLGAYLAKKEGMETIRKAQLDLQSGRIPGEALLDGICILIGAVLLLTPGFITDTVGFLLLAPPTRKFLKGFLRIMLMKWIDRRNVTIIR